MTISIDNILITCCGEVTVKRNPDGSVTIKQELVDAPEEVELPHFRFLGGNYRDYFAGQQPEMGNTTLGCE